MEKKEAIAALIVAAGQGTRFGGQCPKQYMTIDGAPILRRAIEPFYQHSDISQLAVVINPRDSARFTEATQEFQQILPPIAGGNSRQESVYAGLKGLAHHQPAWIVVHDGARPFVSRALIDRILAARHQHGAATAGLRMSDSLCRAPDGRIIEHVARDGIFSVQTPQLFCFKSLLRAHEQAFAQGLNHFTDDSALAKWAGMEIAMVAGDRDNIKITTPEDLERVQAATGGGGFEYRNGTGFDVHALQSGDAITLCGISIPHDQSLIGHSDADVALHALTDAILGAIAEGDIGTHFPPSDARWLGAASDIFLEFAGQRVRARRGEIIHVDMTLICEQPKIGPHRSAMQCRIAEILQIDHNRVSIKATTSEGLGFVGRGEGIAALAQASLRLPTGLM